VTNVSSAEQYTTWQDKEVLVERNSKEGNWKQWKWKPEMENGNRKQKESKLDANEF